MISLLIRDTVHNNNEVNSSAVISLSIWCLFDNTLTSNKDAIWLLRALAVYRLR